MQSREKEARSLIATCGSSLLDLSNLGLTALPPEIGNLTALKALNLTGNDLAVLPPEIGKLTALEALHLAGNGLTALPPEISNLTALKVLDLSNLGLTAFPREIGNLTALKTLNLTGNDLAVLPPEIGKLTALEVLELANNGLAVLPREIGNLTALKALNLSGNDLAVLPREIGNLNALEVLELANNRLAALPPEIGNLAALRGLELANNGLRGLPPEIGNLTALIELYLGDNPLPREILVLSLDELLSYLREQQSGSEPLREVKLVFLGPPEIGKSCLLRHLQGKPFQPGSKTTIGFEVGREPLILGSDPEAIQANCWDFGGQPKYEITHQFFFSKENLFVVAWKPRMGTAQLREWLDLIQQRAGKDAPILVVATHRDESHTPLELDEPEFRRAYPGIVDFSWVTNLDSVEQAMESDEYGKLTTEELRRKFRERVAAAIEDSCAEFAKMRTLLFDLAKDLIILDFPPARLKAREALRALPGASLAFSECRDRCSEYLEIDRVESLLVQMNAIGDIVFHPTEQAENVVILQPEWLGKAISFALDDPARLPHHSGEADHRVLADIWDQHSSQEGYLPEHYTYFIELMRQFDLAYPIDERRSLIPQLVRLDRPLVLFTPEHPTSGGDTQVMYQWRFPRSNPPRGLIPQLTAALSHRRGASEPRQQNWRDGFCLTTDAKQRLYLELKDRTMTLAIRADYPAIFADDLRTEIEIKMKAVWPGADVDLRYPCPVCVSNRVAYVDSFKCSTVDGQLDETMFYCETCGTGSRAETLRQGYAVDPEINRILRELLTLNKLNREQSEILKSLLIDASRHPNRLALIEGVAAAADLGHQVFYLCVYCDDPSHVEPVAKYKVKVPKEWLKKFQKVAHLTGLIAKGFGVAVPGLRLIETATDVKFLADDVLDTALKAIGTGFDKDLDIDESRTLPGSEPTDVHRRMLAALLDQVQDDGGKFGGLNRHVRGTQVTWLCKDHRDFRPLIG